MHDKHQIIEEPCEGKLSRTVLKTNGVGDNLVEFNRAAIQYKVTEAGGVFVEVPTRTVKPSQTCPNCGNQHKKTLDERIHRCEVCDFTMDRDLAAALVMLLWSQGKLPGFETSLVDADASSSTSDTCKRKQTGSQKQLGQLKRQKSVLTGLDAKTSPSTK
jgi:putative transposase